MRMPRRGKRLERAIRSSDPQQRTAAARRALKSAAHKLREVRVLVEGAVEALPGTGAPIDLAELAMSARPVQTVEDTVERAVRQIEGWE